MQTHPKTLKTGMIAFERKFVHWYMFSVLRSMKAAN